MLNKVNDFVLKNELIAKNDKVLIAFSGGADSVFLANYLLSIKNEYNLTLLIAHVEHGIRGEESVRDCEFSRAFASENEMEFHELHINAPQEAKLAGLSVEEYSRNKRYEFFEGIECNKIATAHNLTDNVETLIFRMARGTSLKGLCSIPVKRGKIIRPLLCVSSEEIRAYLDENGVKYCIDSTNSNNDYSRNYIRNVVIPNLKNVNADFVGNTARLINSITEDNSFIDEFVNSIYPKILCDNKLLLVELKKQNVSVQKRVIVKYFKSFNVELDEKHLNDVLSLINKAGKVQIKGKYFAFSDENFLRIAVFKNIDFSLLTVEKKVLTFTEFLNYCKLCNKKFNFYCDCDKICGNVIVRGRASGDSITPYKRNCTKTLKKLFNEYHIPLEDRENVPIICDDLGVIGVYSYCVDSRVAVTESTKNVLIINIRMSTEDNT